MAEAPVLDDPSTCVRPPSKVLSNGFALLDQNEYSGKNKLEPVAVVGFSLKFPQDGVSADSFWEMLIEKRCAMTEFPKDRINLNAFYHPDTDRNDTIPIRGAHFIDDNLGSFDASFFSITTAEAVSMDPQHRGLLETAYRALENSGIPLAKVLGSRTAVYTGCFSDDYQMMVVKDPEILPKYAVTGLAMSLLANRLSWFFNLSGPSVNLDSACSSSMMALDLACQGLRNRDSTMALVAGSNLIVGPELFLTLTNMNFLSPDSRCFSFDDRANGYARGEGFGVVVLKLLSDAIRDDDTIRAVIRSTGSNHDGRTPGITSPSRDAQELLIKETYEKAGLDLQLTRFFEAHGTGTAVGDPIEANAIGAVFREHRSSEEPLYVGAVKSNIGHLEGASGIAGLIKSVMVLERGIIPPNTNFERVNSKIDAEFLNLQFPSNPIPWPSSGLRRASVNSFGFGGANSHAILDDAYNFLRLNNLAGKHCTVEKPPSVEESSYAFTPTPAGVVPVVNNAPHQKPINKRDSNSESKLLVWSAADEAGLGRLAKVYNRHFMEMSPRSVETDAYLSNLAYTLAFRRSRLPWKSFAVVKSISDLREMGVSLSQPIRSTQKLSIGYVFTGQGAQFSGMGQELLAYPVFKNALLKAESYLHHYGCQWSLKDELLREKEASNVNKAAYSQPLCTALQLALIELLSVLNILPSGVIGHSSGEIAAAYCAGGLSFQSACKVAYFRGRLAASLAKSSRHRGAMMSVGLSETEILPSIQKINKTLGDNGIVIACINSPKNVTVSGREVQIDALKSLLGDRVFVRKLQVDVAYHSPQMNDIAAEYLTSIGDLETGELRKGRPVMISSVTGRRISIDELCQGEYWVKNMVSQVKFSDALIELSSQSNRKMTKKLGRAHRNSILIYDILEVGPHSALQSSIRDSLKTVAREKEISYSSVLVRHVPALNTMLHMAGHLHCLGYSVNLAEINRDERKQWEVHSPMTLTNLPEYPFDRSQTFWHEGRLSKDFRLRKNPRLDLLGTPAQDWNPLEARWRKFMRLSETPWVEDHKINGSIIYPAAGMLIMAIEGVRQLADGNRLITGYCIKDATFQKPLVISQSQNGVEVQLYLRSIKRGSEKDSAWSDFRLCVYEDGQWAENCRGKIQVEFESAQVEFKADQSTAESLRHYRSLYDNAIKACDRLVDRKIMYEHLQTMGINYGPAFQSLHHLGCNDEGEAIAEILTSHGSAHELIDQGRSHVMHPTSLDAIAQLVYVALTKGAREHISTTIPTRVGKFWVAQPSPSNSPATAPVVQAYTKSEFKGYRATESSLFALDKVTGNLLMKISSLETTTVADRDAVFERQADQRQLCYSIDTKPDIEILDLQQTRLYCEDAYRQSQSRVEFHTELAFLLFMFVSKTLDALTEREVEELKPHFQRHVRWMRLQIKNFDEGRLILAHPEWKALLQNTEYQDKLCRRMESEDSEGKLFIKVGRNLLEILQGKIDPLILLQDSDLVSTYFLKSNNDDTCFPSFLRYAEALSHKNPALKVLQVGGGVGGPTAPILDALFNHDNPLRYAHFDYTDISPALFQVAQEKYNGCSPRMHFKWLDVESEPRKSGFEPGTYDLIIAGSGLRAARNLETTIQTLRSLLKTGGKFALFEVTEDVMRAGFVFGLVPGWWSTASGHLDNPRNQDDSNGTQDSWLRPYISKNEWHTILSRNRFTGTDVIIPEYQDAMCHEVSILISTALELSPNAVQFPKTLIVVSEDSSIQQAIAQKISKSLISKGCTGLETVLLQRAGSVEDFTKKFCIFLAELDKPILQSMDADTFVKLQSILLSAAGILWVTNGGGILLKTPAFRMIDGLARVLRTERNDLIFVTIALESTESIVEKEIEQITEIFKKTISGTNDDYESEYIEKDGMLHINRMVEDNQTNRDVHIKTRPQQSKLQEFGAGPPLKLGVASPGLLDSLQFLEDTEHILPLAPHEVEIKVHATGVNFMDCLTVLGRINQSTLGGECAGVVTRKGSECNLQPGDRVCACTLDCFKTYVRCDAQLVVEIPVELSFVEAAALPISFVTTHYALQEFARLQKGETVLIHSASGGTGQSAIQMAKHIGAEVYATVGSDIKKNLIKDLYGIPENHIFCSRNTAFAEEIMRMTQGRGVDVVLNSLSDEGLLASWECIASFGRFVEIGKKDIHSHAELPMFPFAKNVSFGAVDIAAMSRERPALLRKSLQAVLTLVRDRQLHAPQPLSVYPVSGIENAFRYMQSGKNMGKAVVNFETNDLVLTVLDTKPTYYFDTNATYLISGGLGGLGRSAARWMATRGAKNLILLSRSGPRTEAAKTLIEELRAQGVQVEAPICDVTCTDSLSTVLAQCAQTLPPIKGCIQGTMVLKDAIFEKMTFAQWNDSIRPKVQGSWNLHSFLPPGMDFFILLSSVSGVIGSGGQTNYAAGNTYMDALAHFRISRGEKAVSLDLGWMESEGVVAESKFLQKGLAAAGYLMPIGQGEFFALLDHYCNPALELLTPLSCQTVVGLETRTAVRAKGIDSPLWMQRPMFRVMYHQAGTAAASSSDGESDSSAVDYAAAFAHAHSLAEAGAKVADGLVAKLARALAVPPDDIDPSKPLHAYGVDSLLAVELRNWSAKEINADVAVFDVMGSISITALGVTIAANSQFRQASWETDV